MEQYIQQANKFFDVVDGHLKGYPQVQQLAQKAKVRPAHLACGAVGLAIMFFFFGFGAKALSNLVGFVYPMYGSFKALKTSDKNDDAMWLTYWVVYGAFSLIESFTDILLFWIPAYHLWKIAFLVWCFMPQTKGAKKIFDSLIEPLLSKYESQIDEHIEKAKQQVNTVGAQLGRDAAKSVIDMAAKQQ